MQIEKAIISKLESLAQLALAPVERLSIQNDLNAILKMIEAMDELDTSAVEPLVYLHENQNILRKDAISGHTDRNLALENSAEHTNAFFKVPKVINK